MPDLSSFPIAQRWPAAHPDRLQLYAAPTPNGVKVSIMLEEIGLAYEPHFVDISKNESKDPAFVSLNPNGRIPAIIDPHGPSGVPIGVWESGAILVYLAEKSGKLMPAAPERRYDTLAWVFSRCLQSDRCSVSWASSCAGAARTLRTGVLCSASRTSPNAYSACWIDSWKGVTGSLTSTLLPMWQHSAG